MPVMHDDQLRTMTNEASSEQTPTLGEWSWRKDAFKGYAHASARENQLLATDWGALSSIDVRTIIDVINKRLLEAPKLSELEAMLGILGALTTGRRFDDWLNFILCPSEGAVSFPANICLTVRNGRSEWVLPIGRYQKRAIAPSIAPLLITPLDQIKMACPPLMQHVLERCLRDTLPSAPTPLFSFSEQPATAHKEQRSNLRILAGKLLRTRTQARSSTQTLQGVERWLWRAMAAAEGGDPATACRATGRANLLAAKKAGGLGEGGEVIGWASPKFVETQLFYGVTRADHARRLQEEVLKAVGLSSTIRPRRDEGHVGGRRTPKLSTLQRFAAHSSATLTRARRSGHFVDLHNGMVRHTAAILMFATGVRPHKDALLRSVDRPDLIVAFDKKVGDLRVRLLPFIDICEVQLILYRSHLDSLSSVIPVHLQEALVTGVENDLPLFILTDSSTVQAEGLAACWKAALEDFTPGLPENLHRHHLRSFLASAASHESVDAFLGHWIIGTEPWGRFSGLDPLEYRADLDRVLGRGMKQMGWKPEHGLTPTNKPDASSYRGFIIGKDKQEEPIGTGPALRAEFSPFNNVMSMSAFDHERYDRFFEDRSHAMPETLEGRLGQILVSAICRGAFLDQKWFDPFIAALPAACLNSDRIFLVMDGVPEENYNHVYGNTRRWFCDPVTELLLRRWRSSSLRKTDLALQPSAALCLDAYLRHSSITDEEAVVKLVKAATLYWRLRLPGVLASYTVGEGPSLSLTSAQWSRVASGRPVKYESAPKSGKTPAVKRVSSKRTELLTSLLDGLQRNAPVTTIEQLSSSLLKTNQSLIAHLMHWAALALRKRRRARYGLREWGQKKPYASSTVRNYASILGHAVFKGELFKKLSVIDSEWLDMKYREALGKVEHISTKNKMLNAIYSFQSYLWACIPLAYVERTGYMMRYDEAAHHHAVLQAVSGR